MSSSFSLTYKRTSFIFVYMKLNILPFEAKVAYLPDCLAAIDTAGEPHPALARSKRLSPLAEHHYSAFEERPYTRRTLRGAIIVDGVHGVTYECIAERRGGVPTLLRKTAIAVSSDGLESLSQFSDSQLAMLTVTFMEQHADTPWDAMELLPEDSGVDAPQAERLRPSVEQIAKHVEDSLRSGLSPRGFLSDFYRVSLPTADKWIARARETGLIPPAAGNRGRRPARTENQK